MHLKFSQDIETLLKQLAEKPLTLRDILSETSERGFSLVILLLILPFLFPTPPGLTTIIGSGCLLLSGEMALGMRKPWLPRKIANFQFPKAVASILLTNLKRVTGILEKITRPRFSRIAKNRYVWQVNGACLAWLTVLLMLPIPATNPIPTVCMLLLIVATLEADGLLMFVSYILTILVSLFFAGIMILPFWAPQLFPEFLKMFQKG